ncbi:MAG: hypothetical protein LAQ30_26245 [Acidobacteriia bacterium]|nr:hypothetical protein [Terriglobia bacterium]
MPGPCATRTPSHGSGGIPGPCATRTPSHGSGGMPGPCDTSVGSASTRLRPRRASPEPCARFQAKASTNNARIAVTANLFETKVRM